MVSNVIQNDNHINICLASDNNFVQHLAVTIASILDNAKTSKCVDIYILNDGSISEKNKYKIQNLTKLKKESSINFIDIDGSIFPNMFIRRKSHFTLATYYRFLLQDLFPQLSKILETKIQKLENELSYLKHIVKDELKNTMGEKCKIR